MWNVCCNCTCVYLVLLQFGTQLLICLRHRNQTYLIDQLMVFFWVSAPCSRCVSLHFRGMYCLHLEGEWFWFILMLKWLGGMVFLCALVHTQFGWTICSDVSRTNKNWVFSISYQMQRNYIHCWCCNGYHPVWLSYWLVQKTPLKLHVSSTLRKHLWVLVATDTIHFNYVLFLEGILFALCNDWQYIL